MLSQYYFGAKYFSQGFLAGQPADVTPQGGTFLLALHGTGGAAGNIWQYDGNNWIYVTSVKTWTGTEWYDVQVVRYWTGSEFAVAA